MDLIQLLTPRGISMLYLQKKCKVCTLQHYILTMYSTVQGNDKKRRV